MTILLTHKVMKIVVLIFYHALGRCKKYAIIASIQGGVVWRGGIYVVSGRAA